MFVLLATEHLKRNNNFAKPTKQEVFVEKGKVEYTWEEFDADCILLAEKINFQKEDVLVYVTAEDPGGIFLAKAIGDILKTDRIYFLSYSVQKQGENLDIRAAFPISPGLANLRIFLITPRSRSGVILKKAKDDLEKLGNKVSIVAIHYHEGSDAIPDYYAYKLEAGCQVEYPREWARG